MQDILCEMSPRGSGARSGRGLTMLATVLATVLLSFGVGTATAAFTLMNAAPRHSVSFVACDTIPLVVEVQGLGDLDVPALAPLFAAGALAMLVVSARGAARMLSAPHAPEVVAISAIGALFVSAMLISAFGLPSMGLRAVAFAICVSMLAARFARVTRTELLPART
jgi:hypothetical protein